MKNIKVDPKKVLPIVGGLLSVAGVVISNVIDTNNRKTMKSEIKDEILKEMLSDKN